MEATTVAQGAKTCYLATDDNHTLYYFTDEFYGEAAIELTDEEIADHARVCAEFDDWQDRLQAAVTERAS